MFCYAPLGFSLWKAVRAFHRYHLYYNLCHGEYKGHRLINNNIGPFCRRRVMQEEFASDSDSD